MNEMYFKKLAVRAFNKYGIIVNLRYDPYGQKYTFIFQKTKGDGMTSKQYCWDKILNSLTDAHIKRAFDDCFKEFEIEPDIE